MSQTCELKAVTELENEGFLSPPVSIPDLTSPRPHGHPENLKPNCEAQMKFTGLGLGGVKVELKCCL